MGTLGVMEDGTDEDPTVKEYLEWLDQLATDDGLIQWT